MHDSKPELVVASVRQKPERIYYQSSKTNNVLSTFGSMEGYRAESRVVEAWKPAWKNRRRFAQVIVQVRPTTSFEDKVEKFDAVFETVIPGYERIGVQIKTSLNAYLEFSENYPDVPVVLISTFDSATTIRKKTLFMILHKFPDLITEMDKRGCKISPRVVRKLEEVSNDHKVCLF